MGAFEALNEILTDVTPTGGPQSLSDVLFMAVNLLMSVGIGVGILAIAYAFIMYITSAGNPDKVKQAFNAVLWAGIAIFVTAASWAFRAILLNIVGFSGEEDFVRTL